MTPSPQNNGYIVFVQSQQCPEKLQNKLQKLIVGANIVVDKYTPHGLFCVVQQKLQQEQLQRQQQQHLQLVKKLMIPIKMKDVLDTDPEPGYEPLTHLQVTLHSLHEKHQFSEPPQILLDLNGHGDITPAMATQKLEGVFHSMQSVLQRRNPIKMLDDSASNLSFSKSGPDILAWIKDQVESVCVASQLPEHQLRPQNGQTNMLWKDFCKRVDDRRNSGLLQLQLSLYNMKDELEYENGGRPLGVSAEELYQRALTVGLNSIEDKNRACALTAKALQVLVGNSYDLAAFIAKDLVVTRRDRWRTSGTDEDHAEVQLALLPSPPLEVEGQFQEKAATPPDTNKKICGDDTMEKEVPPGDTLKALVLPTQDEHSEQTGGFDTPNATDSTKIQSTMHAGEVGGTGLKGGNCNSGSADEEEPSEDRKRKVEDLSAENERLKKELESLKAKTKVIAPAPKKKHKTGKEIPKGPFDKLFGILSGKYGWVKKEGKHRKYWYAPSSFKGPKCHKSNRRVVDRVLTHESFEGDEELLAAAQACKRDATPQQPVDDPTTTSNKKSAPSAAVSTPDSSNVKVEIMT